MRRKKYYHLNSCIFIGIYLPLNNFLRHISNGIWRRLVDMTILKENNKINVFFYGKRCGIL
jgi:hypothetical protein